MQIDVIATCGEARSEDLAGKTALIIDVLRATSNMVTALAYGCRSLLPVETVQQAKQAAMPDDLLGGERSCKKIPGFDLGNSPFEYMTDIVKGKRIVTTTTNGTRAVQKAQKAGAVIACAMLNAGACAEAAVEFGRDVQIVCSGTKDIFSLEDGLCAGLLIEEMKRFAKLKGLTVHINDFGLAMNGYYSHAANNLEAALFGCSNGHRLRRLGFRDDIGYCAQINIHRTVPILRCGELVLHKHALRP